MIRLWSGHAAFFCIFFCIFFCTFFFCTFFFCNCVLQKINSCFQKNMSLLTVYRIIRNFVEMTKKWNQILLKSHYGAIPWGFLMSKKRTSTLFSTGNVDNLSWIFYGMQVYHITGNALETDFENCHNN